MIKRIFFLIPLLVLIISCSDFKFVYNAASFEKLKEKTLFSIKERKSAQKESKAFILRFS